MYQNTPKILSSQYGLNNHRTTNDTNFDIPSTPGNQKKVLTNSLHDKCFLNKDTVELISTHLFSRATESHKARTKIENLRDLFAFAMCHRFFYESIYYYIKDLASHYAKDTELYHNQCFKVCSVKDGIKTLMIQGCEDNRIYLIHLNSAFQNKVTAYLFNSNPNARAEGTIDRTIRTLSVVIKTKTADATVTEIISNLSKVLLDEEALPQIKSNALTIIKKLNDYRCFHPNNKNLIFIINLLKALLDKNDNQVVALALDTICAFVRTGFMKDLPSELLSEMLDKANHLLDRNDLNISLEAMHMIDIFLKASLMKGVSRQKIIDILLNAKQLLDHKNWQIVGQALITIGQFARARLIKCLPKNEITNISVKAKALLYHNEWPVLFRALWTLLSIENIDKNSLLASITEDQIRVLYQGILGTRQNLSQKKTVMMVFRFLLEHTSFAVKQMSNEILSQKDLENPIANKDEPLNYYFLLPDSASIDLNEDKAIVNDYLNNDLEKFLNFVQQLLVKVFTYFLNPADFSQKSPYPSLQHQTMSDVLTIIQSLVRLNAINDFDLLLDLAAILNQKANDPIHLRLATKIQETLLAVIKMKNLVFKGNYLENITKERQTSSLHLPKHELSGHNKLKILSSFFHLIGDINPTIQLFACDALFQELQAISPKNTDLHSITSIFLADYCSVFLSAAIHERALLDSKNIKHQQLIPVICMIQGLMYFDNIQNVVGMKNFDYILQDLASDLLLMKNACASNHQLFFEIFKALNLVLMRRNPFLDTIENVW